MGHTYLVSVTAVNAIGESAASNILTVNAGTIPSKIYSVSYVSSTTTTIKFKWLNPTSNGGLPITKFTVYMDVGQTGTFTAYQVTDPSQNYYESGALASRALVDVQVTSWNVNGESQKSDIVTFYVATVPATPSVPTETQIFLLNGYTSDAVAIQVSWTAPADNGADITGYRLYMAENANQF